jgi:hypothetical protein
LFTLIYKKLQLYSSGKYVFDIQKRNDNFFYTWSQLTCSPLKWLQVGLVSQRTRVYHTSLDVQRGALVGFTHEKLTFTTNVFNFGWTTPTEVLALGLSFECGSSTTIAKGTHPGVGPLTALAFALIVAAQKVIDSADNVRDA